MAGEYIRNTQESAEVLRDGTPSIRNTQESAEVLRDGTPSIRNTQIMIEVLRVWAVDTSTQPNITIMT